jgi:hypothetical protein
MSLLTLERIQLGEVGIKPGTVKMVSTDNLATITTAGYLNGVGSQIPQVQLAPSDIIECLYSYNASTDSGTFTLLRVSISGGVISLSVTSGDDALTNAHIFVGNSSNVATDVAMSGDATIANTGAVTIANNAITTVKIADANVTLAKLAAGITPSHVIKFASQVTTVGGAAAEAFTVTGAVAATDRAFVQVVDNGTANVTALQAVVTNNTLTVTFSADPGNDTIINYQIIRAVS